MKRVILPDAEADLRAGSRFYQSREKGLGKEFRHEFREACTEIVSNPLAFPEYEGGDVRVYIMSRFPYSIVYAIKSEVIGIVALIHHSRGPTYWNRRLAQWRHSQA